MKQKVKLLYQFSIITPSTLSFLEIIEFENSLSNDQFILANIRSSGFYRINYDPYFWDLIVKQLLWNKDVNNKKIVNFFIS